LDIAFASLVEVLLASTSNRLIIEHQVDLARSHDGFSKAIRVAQRAGGGGLARDGTTPS
jgi:hypothetical protein